MEMTLPDERRNLNGTMSSSVVRLWQMFAQDERSLGGLPVDIVEISLTIDIRLEGIGNRARAPYISIERSGDTPGSC